MSDQPLALIIEDDGDLAVIFAEAFKGANFIVEISRDGANARQRLQEIAPEVVVLDFHLPHVAGTDLLAQIRSEDRLKDVLVVVITADGRKAATARDIADFVLVKPVTFKQLRELSFQLRDSLILSNNS